MGIVPVRHWVVRAAVAVVLAVAVTVVAAEVAAIRGPSSHDLPFPVVTRVLPWLGDLIPPDVALAEPATGEGADATPGVARTTSQSRASFRSSPAVAVTVPDASGTGMQSREVSVVSAAVLRRLQDARAYGAADGSLSSVLRPPEEPRTYAAADTSDAAPGIQPDEPSTSGGQGHSARTRSSGHREAGSSHKAKSATISQHESKSPHRVRGSQHKATTGELRAARSESMQRSLVSASGHRKTAAERRTASPHVKRTSGVAKH